MENVSKILLCNTAILLAFFLSSCDNGKDPTKDTALPKVIITGIAEDQRVWNTVSVNIKATDNDQIANVEILIDDQSLSILSEEPFDFAWNTNEHLDGVHTIKAIARDLSGNMGVVEVTVTISNVLIAAKVPALHVRPAERKFIILSDDEGDFIAGAELKNNENIVLKAPGFNGEKFYLTEVGINMYDGYNWCDLYSFMDVPRGEWRVAFPPREVIEHTYMDTAYLNFINPVPGYRYDINARGMVNDVDADHLSETLFLSHPDSKLFITAFDEQNHRVGCKLFPAVRGGINPPVDLSEITEPYATKNIYFPADAADGGAYLAGLARANAYDESYSVGSFSMANGKAEIAYPGSVFPGYVFSGSCAGPNYRFEFNSREITDIIPFNYNFEIKFFADHIVYTTNGSFDFARYCLSKERSTWSYTVKKGSAISIPRIQIPDFIPESAALNSQSWNYHFEYLFDYEDINDNDDLIQAIKSTDGVMYTFTEIGKVYKIMDLYSQPIEFERSNLDENADSKSQINTYFVPWVMRPSLSFSHSLSGPGV